MNPEIKSVSTSPIDGQKTGTSGLRKKVKEITETKNYLENFVWALVQAIMALDDQEQVKSMNTYMVLGGDGRYYNKQAIQTIISIFAAYYKELLQSKGFSSENNKFSILVGKDGILSTPALSCIIRERKCGYGGIILTASHNPGGPENDWGIKYNSINGGPANESITDKIVQNTLMIKEYKIAQLDKIDLGTIGVKSFFDGKFNVEVVDSMDDYVCFLKKEVFDFELLKSYAQKNSKDFKMLFDAMHGVTGPYSRRIFLEELGLPESSVINSISKEDFNGGHPDPNLTYAKELVDRMFAKDCNIALGAASDGDGDRNMILGNQFFVTPSDSVAVIAQYAVDCIPYFSKQKKLKGLARSMPTSTSIDRVAQKLNIPFYEVPTGWKYFGNLMDAGKLSICGEESFGTSSDHIREKDGIWAVLAWLSILAYKNKDGNKCSIKDIVMEHWKEFGRSFYVRYDYENVSSESANKMMDRLSQMIESSDKAISKGSKYGSFTIDSASEFEYVDPIDKSVAKKQGIRFYFTDGSRFVFRLSGTGSSGATIRLYMETYVEPSKDSNSPEYEKQMNQDAKEVVKELLRSALEISQLSRLTGRENPTVIT